MYQWQFSSPSLHAHIGSTWSRKQVRVGQTMLNQCWANAVSTCIALVRILRGVELQTLECNCKANDIPIMHFLILIFSSVVGTMWFQYHHFDISSFNYLTYLHFPRSSLDHNLQFHMQHFLHVLILHACYFLYLRPVYCLGLSFPSHYSPVTSHYSLL